MGDGNWLRRGWRSKHGKQNARGKAKRRNSSRKSDSPTLSIEPLEDRRVLAAFLVNNAGDLDGDGNVILGTLRWALNKANAEDDRDTIVFADSLFSATFGEVAPGSTAGIRTISLNGGQLTISQPVEILGPGAFQLHVRQTRPQQRVFEVNIGAEDEFFSAEISGMAISGGNITGTGDDKFGGAVFNHELLTMTEVRLINNIASTGGGAIYNERGRVTLDRSFVYGNSAGQGGGVLNGKGDDEVSPTTIITNSTFYNNTAFGAGGERPAYGGGVFNRKGTLEVNHSTFVGNTSTLDTDDEKGGGGIASYGNPVPEDEDSDPPPEEVFTFLYSTIATGNDGNDVQRVGKTDDDEEPMELLPSIHSLGFNIVTAGNAAESGDDFALGETGDQALVDPKLLTDDDGNFVWGDFGGSSEVFLLDSTSPAIDAGGDSDESFDQRGMHFTRLFGSAPDVGAVEMQEGVFFVDTLLDDDDRSFAQVSLVTIQFGQPVVSVGSYESPGELSLREAIEFAQKNPGPDTIRFHQRLNTVEIIEREDLNGGLPTITLGILQTAAPPVPSRGAVLITDSVVIEGPTNFILEVDASGNDPTPGINEGNGSRVFEVDNLDAATLIDVSISNLTMMGGDEVGRGGGILSKENLTLRHVTVKENAATDDGGGLYHALGALTIEESTFNSNRAADDGGGLFLDTPAGTSTKTDAAIVNSTFSGNVAGDRGAGILNQNSSLGMKFNTITLNNSGSTRGSGVTNIGADAETNVYATVISNNVGNDVEFFSGATAATFISQGYNYIGRGNGITIFTQAGDRSNANTPMLAPLFNTGGLIQTHRPLAGSPLIDAGPSLAPGSGLGGPATDQRGEGFERARDGNLDGAVFADIGSYELQELTLLVDSLSDENDGDTSMGNFSLREAIQLANDNPLPDRIEFEPSFLQQISVINDPSINLSRSSLQPFTPPDLRITDSVTIVGPGSAALAIEGDGLAPVLSSGSQYFLGSRMFTIDDGDGAKQIDVSISGLTLRGARAPQAGAVIWSRENVTLDDVALLNNKTIDPDETLAQQTTVDQTGLHGGAIYQQTGTLTILNSLLSGNSTSDFNAHGGAIYVTGGKLVLNDSSVAGNVTEISGDGGGIALINSTFELNTSSITGNSTLGGVGDGGGFFATGSVITLHDGTISDNSTIGANAEGAGFSANNSQVSMFDTSVTLNRTTGSQGSGAGLFASGGTLTTDRSLIAQNTASGLQSWGGGVALVGGSATFNRSSIELNQVSGAGANGGGVSNVGGVLVIRDTTIHGNQATNSQSKGGGVYSDTNLPGTQSTLILNSTISGNSATLRGGGVFNADGLLTIQHSTITDNSTPMANVGAGVASQGNTATRTVVSSSIIAGNRATLAGAANTDVDLVDGTFTNSFDSDGFNIIGAGNATGAFAGLANPSDRVNVVNPMLGPLTDNGPGDLFFILRTHALLEGSPAINAGDPNFNPANYSPPLGTDERGAGFARVKHNRIDAGALESDFAGMPAADFNGDAAVDGLDFLTWQRNLGKTSATKPEGDANGDGLVNAVDLSEWRIGFGTSVAEEAGAAASASYSAALVADDEAPAMTAPAQAALEPSVFLVARADSQGRATVANQAALSEEAAYRLAAIADDGFAALYDDGDSPLRYAGPDAADELGGRAATGNAAPEDAVFAMLGSAL